MRVAIVCLQEVAVTTFARGAIHAVLWLENPDSMLVLGCKNRGCQIGKAFCI
jgi:hypothetical protein